MRFWSKGQLHDVNTSTPAPPGTAHPLEDKKLQRTFRMNEDLFTDLVETIGMSLSGNRKKGHVGSSGAIGECTRLAVCLKRLSCASLLDVSVFFSVG